MKAARVDWRSVVVGGCSLLVLGCIALAVLALAAGYRPVVIKTGSMGDAAPVGSLVVAAPRSAADIDVGDIVVMRRPGNAPITHRVVELQAEGDVAVAITQGDANPAPDAAPYPLGDDELVARWIVPGVGSAVEAIRDPRLILVALGLIVLAGCTLVLRRIWTADVGRHDSGPSLGSAGGPLPPPLPGTPAFGAPSVLVATGQSTRSLAPPLHLGTPSEVHDPGSEALTASASVPVPTPNGRRAAPSRDRRPATGPLAGPARVGGAVSSWAAPHQPPVAEGRPDRRTNR